MLKDYLIGRVGEAAVREAKLPLIKEVEVGSLAVSFPYIVHSCRPPPQGAHHNSAEQRNGWYACTAADLTQVLSLQEVKAGKADTTDLVALNPKKKIPFELVEKIELSSNTRLFRFALQSPNHCLGLPVGQHMFFYAKVRRCSQGVAALP